MRRNPAWTPVVGLRGKAANPTYKGAKKFGIEPAGSGFAIRPGLGWARFFWMGRVNNADC